MPLHLTEAPSLPYWRALLEARWQARLQKLIQLSLAYHDAAAADGDHRDRAAARRMRETLRDTVAARRGLADTEDALGRLAAARFGLCEQCGATIAASLLALTPETRYCPACDGDWKGERSPGPDPAQPCAPVNAGCRGPGTRGGQ